MVLLTTLLLHAVGSQTSPPSGQISSMVRRWSSEDLMAAQGCTRLTIQQVGLASKLNALICAPNVFSVSLRLVSAISGDHP